MRYVILAELDETGNPVVKDHPDAAADEVTGRVMRLEPALDVLLTRDPASNRPLDLPVRLMIAPGVIPTRLGMVDDKTGQVKSGAALNPTTGMPVPGDTVTTEENGSTIETVESEGGELRLTDAAGTVVATYPAGGWKSCTELPPHFMVAEADRDFTSDTDFKQ